MSSEADRNAKPHTRARGERVERAVGVWLSARGLRILDRNVHAAGAELDLVAEVVDATPRTLVFVEVRSRRHADHGDPLETISVTKRRHLVRGATAWLVACGLWERVAVRFDCVGVVGEIPEELELHGMDAFEISWIKNAFAADDA